jgi:Concanavalin A-like lectin/glucanases superfamily
VANPGIYATAVLAEDPGQQSPSAPGTLNLGAPGLIETLGLDRSMQVNGGFVSVSVNAALNPPKTPGFTVEAWVVAEWDSGETGFFRSVIDSNGDGGVPSGYSLYAGPDPLNAADPKYYWQAYVGTGTELQFVRSSSPVAVGQITYLVLTYDGTTETLTLYSADMEMDLNAMLTPPQITVSYSQNLTAPLFIGMGNPAGPSPLWPFQGRIQEVAIYQKALDAVTIEKHGFAGLVT